MFHEVIYIIINSYHYDSEKYDSELDVRDETMAHSMIIIFGVSRSYVKFDFGEKGWCYATLSTNISGKIYYFRNTFVNIEGIDHGVCCHFAAYCIVIYFRLNNTGSYSSF